MSSLERLEFSVKELVRPDWPSIAAIWFAERGGS